MLWSVSPWLRWLYIFEWVRLDCVGHALFGLLQLQPEASGCLFVGLDMVCM
jgi:hypothetical protein